MHRRGDADEGPPELTTVVHAARSDNTVDIRLARQITLIQILIHIPAPYHTGTNPSDAPFVMLVMRIETCRDMQ